MRDEDASQPGAGAPDVPDEAEDGAPAPAAITAKRKTPVWAGLAFVVLLGGVYIVANVLNSGGPPIEWLDSLPATLKKADESKRLVFLYLFEPGAAATRDEREIFAKRAAREPLTKVACCRVALTKNDPLAVMYEYKGQPVMLLLDAKGAVRSRAGGDAEPVSDLQFKTYIADPIENHLKRLNAGGASQQTP
jgi:hypothetical protein